MSDNVKATFAYLAILCVMALAVLGAYALIRVADVTRDESLAQVRRDRAALIVACDKLGMKAQYSIVDDGGPDIWLIGECVQP